MTNPIKMKDIAEALGVSIATVSRSLSGAARISPKTRERVRQEVERRGYVVDLAARTMRSGTSSVVGLLVPDIENDFYSTAAKAIADCCRERGVQLVLAITDDDASLELHHLRNLCSARALGLIMIPSISPLPETIRLMRAMPHIQFVRHHAKVDSDWFGIDDSQAMRLATQHLVDLGHRRIAYIGSTVAISTGQARLSGFQRTLVEAGIEIDESLVRAGSCNAEFGYAAMESILSSKTRPTAVVTAGARVCVGAYDCVRQRGIDVPGELSFVGFSDGPMIKWCGNGISTIALPVRELAMASTDYLFRMAASARRRKEAPCKVMLLPTMVERGSTASPKLPAAKPVARPRERQDFVRLVGAK